MDAPSITDAKQRFLDRLKLDGPATAAQLAGAFGLSDVAVRQHLLVLERIGLVTQTKQSPEGRGRPAILWSLAEGAERLFPERHAELTVALIEGIRKTLGTESLHRVIEARGDEQIKTYRDRLPGATAPLLARVNALARQRTAEGYMAEVVHEPDGGILLIEHHCPICTAARCCVALCDDEQRVFDEVLGPSVTVERTEHVVSGDRRCTYSIRPTQ